MTAAEAAALLAAAKDHPRLGAYVILSLTTGIRTEEARALRWDHVDLDGDPEARSPVPPSIAVWRSVRLHGDTKTEKSRRTLALPRNAVTALREHRKWQASSRLAAGPLWQDTSRTTGSRHFRVGRAALAIRCRLAARGTDAQQLIGEPPCCRTGLAHRGQHQVDVPFQAHALNRDEPQNAVWCGQHRVPTGRPERSRYRRLR